MKIDNQVTVAAAVDLFITTIFVLIVPVLIVLIVTIQDEINFYLICFFFFNKTWNLGI